MDIRNYELVVDNLEKNPHCLHGPSLVFQENVGKMKSYYACSACRDKKNCSFYIPINEKKKIIDKTSSFWKQQQKEVLSLIEKLKPYKKFIGIMKGFKKKSISNNSNNTEFGYCYTCNCLFKTSDCGEHTKCKVVSELTYYELMHPTSILVPKTDAKTHAQYFFSESTINEICLLLTRLNTTKVLCIGVPKIHEYVLNNPEKKIKSLLLDFDKNYFNFYSTNDFIWYNMFNNYLFDEKQEKVLHKFLKSGRIVVLMDPPFGGRVEPLARTLSELSKTFCDINGEYEKGKTTRNVKGEFLKCNRQIVVRSIKIGLF